MSTKEAMDSAVTRRRATAPKAGSVWETRMKLDQVKGGIKVFNANHQQDPQVGSPVDSGDGIGTRQSPVGSAKRKTWKSDGLDQGSPIQLGRLRSEVSRNLDDKFKESSGKKSPVQLRKVRSDSAGEKFDRIPLGEKSRSEEESVGCEMDEQVSENAQSANHKEEQEEEEEEKDKENGNEIEVGIENEAKKSANPGEEIASGKSEICAKSTHLPDSNNFHGVPRTRSILQSFAELIMWKDVAKSSFIFGIGTFAIISSSYTKDLSISFISVVSYLGLAYLAVNFLFRSLVTRGNVDNNTTEDYVIGEEEAVWAIKLVLPHVNEFLVKMRALFSGDPVTTMKPLAVGSAAVCFGEMWQLYNDVEDG
ncbi:hypothetical protein F511_28327 [Dorcoceras hygrometricum]|uniref:Reticulon domain-containing protein n=1 Tax=Dorcoceras hygrometricum TaxID=472368 RepID=A0A2Z7AKU1_9LAMI|nr:hypothetical protein F511_28327 [Dorcoceras hygrometricum]